MTPHGNLLGPEPTLLPEDPAGALLDGGVEPAEVAATHPTSSLAWAVLAESALQDGVVITGYAYARHGPRGSGRHEDHPDGPGAATPP